MSKFLSRHPFISSLIKRTVRIVVTWNVVVLCLFGTLFGFIMFGAVMSAIAGDAEEEEESSYEEKNIYGDGSGKLLSIKIAGPILGSSDSAGDISNIFSSGLTATYGYDVKTQIMNEAKSGESVGIILEIDSPGGTIFGSKAIADGVDYYKEMTKNPVYAHIQGVGASGAYWAAVSADKIYADTGTLTGNIGVIAGPFQYYDKPTAIDGGLLGGGIVTQNGIENTYISAGTSKDAGQPFRRLTTDEVNLFQKMTNQEYDIFVAHVAEHRPITDSEIRTKVGAFAYNTTLALEHKLIDSVASREKAYQDLAKAAEVGDDFQVVRHEPKPTGIDSLFQSFLGNKNTPPQVSTLCLPSHVPLAFHGNIAELTCK